MLAPFFIDQPYGKIMAIVGLALLTRQAYQAKHYNLVCVNAVGIIGYFWSIL